MAVKNRGEVDQIIVEGKHEPLVSKDDFSRVQRIMDSHIIKMKNGRYKPVAKTLSMWSRKVVCKCGHSFVRNKINCPNGDFSYYFYCYTYCFLITLQS